MMILTPQLRQLMLISAEFNIFDGKILFVFDETQEDKEEWCAGCVAVWGRSWEE